MSVLQQWVSDGRVTTQTILIDAVSGQHAPANTFMLVQPLFQNAPPLPMNQPPVQPAKQSGSGNVQVVVNNTMPSTPFGHALPNKSRMVAGLLALFLGGIGIHQFYLGKNGLGVTMLLICVCTCGYGGIITGIWALINAISIFTGSERDSRGYPLV
jgi:TM2 domain-containing membrane protein YozV